MKKIFFLILMISFFYGYSQNNDSYNYKFIYEYQFQVDSTDIHSLKQENMILILNKEKSYFYSSSRFSITDLVKNNPNLNLSELMLLRKKLPKNKIKTEIEKDLRNLKLSYFEKISSYIYTFKEKLIDFNWQIKAKEKVINGILCKKATTTFAGRNYIAWFTNEIPISNGPYKFGGLPGFIIEISDSKNHHHFVLKSFKKEKGLFPVYKKKPINASMNEIIKAKKNMFKNSNFTFTANREVIKKAKERLKKRNNPIELYNK